MTRLLILLLLAFQAPQESDGPACNNFATTKAADRCKCARALKPCDDEGKPGNPDEAPDEALGTQHCKRWSKPDKCMCVSPCTSHLKRNRRQA